ncbi:phosphocholine-specific phospholipase C [Pedobacter nutrimenti]|uniref:phospholipase C n=1 Tax=Pedobacter nutrimenti TaxID=1241337 RepID=A0A318UT35_9SPHI|nr:phospholipase C, phosphocholine-specific [Pedobacter nutrimenti]PYF74779.1 phospholipase C [Pedobacter nutrimenti]
MDNRRDFIKKASLLAGTFGLSGILPPSIQRALAINPDPGTTYLDAEHVVFLMQENRSFDHVFGSLKGVRGFNDPRAITLANNYPVWLQTNKKNETYAPFRLNIKDTKATWMSSLPHSWDNQVDARNNGKFDGWLEAKRSGNKAYADMPLTMGYYNREDVPFYYALADAFTVCDHNFCSSLTGTSPNRCFFWTAKIREEQNAASKPHLSNGDIDGSERISWSTFPERLSAHDIDWKIYQNELSAGVGFEGEQDEWLGNFTDNPIEFFKQYHVKRHPEHISFLKKSQAELTLKIQEKADPKLQKKLTWVTKELDFLEQNPLEQLSPQQQDLHRRAFVTNRNDPDYHRLEDITYLDNGIQRTVRVPKGDVLHQFRADVDKGKLPAVSWLVAPCNFSDHPSAPWYGAWYLSEVIDILTKNPEVWKKTIFVLTYDENDGYFDHMPPFVAPNPKNPATGLVSASLDISAEFVPAEKDIRESPVGLGYRVPMVVVSPWSRGGYVNSQVFDHTSSIQFLEHFLSHKTGKKVHEDNITSWRRSLCGDLTTVFRPYHGEKLSLPKKIERKPFIEGIHKARFAKLPDNFKSLSQKEILEVIKDPLKTSHLPKQEPGIKPANALPYEVYAHGKLDQLKGEFHVAFTAGNTYFGEAASGVGFNVYAADDCWAFTAAAGDTLHYQWPLEKFKQQQYDLKIYSANGFYRRYKGNLKDPDLSATLSYEHKKSSLVLQLKREAGMEEIKFVLTDLSYGQGHREIVLAKGQTELRVTIDLSKSYNWYDLILKTDQYPAFSQQFAGHLERQAESFTDPLLGGL